MFRAVRPANMYQTYLNVRCSSRDSRVTDCHSNVSGLNEAMCRRSKRRNGHCRAASIDTFNHDTFNHNFTGEFTCRVNKNL